MKSKNFACALLVILIGGLTGCTAGRQAQTWHAEIIRTEGGIPHIYADDWGSLGFGTLYAMAEDNVCLLGRQYLKFGARQVEYLGETPANLASDFFYQLLIDRNSTPPNLDSRLDQLFAGAAAGYNHYLEDTGVDNITDPDCRGADWLLPVSAIDLQRVSGVDYALDYMHAMIAAAEPPAPGLAAARWSAMDEHSIALAVDDYLEVPKQGGSNAIAVGGDTALGARSLLVANPHMSWNNPYQRFYPMHQVIPGQIDMLGANLIGRPRVGFGTGRHLAWTSTVSTAKRVSFYQLKLVPGQPTRYLFDGEEQDMIEETVKVGGRSHTFYSTHFGALLVQSPFFKWSNETAVAVMLPEPGFRGENSAFEQYAAKTVRELKAVHNKYQFLTVNLVAADDSGEVMYTDPGPVPNISNQQLETCPVLRGAAYDGSRSDCLWQNDTDAVSRGIIGPARLPLLYRRDYVTNSNDSYWLANPAQPLEGYPAILGTENKQRTLRTRSGLQMVQGSIARDGGISLQSLMDMTLANENYAGQLIRDDLVKLCRESNRKHLLQACEVLANWDLHDNLDSRGTHLLRQMLASANGPTYTRYLPTSFIPAVAFDPEDPLNTPRGLAQTDNEAVLEHLARAVQTFENANIALDATLGELQSTTRGSERIPIHGGPEQTGVFNKIESALQGERGYPEVTRSSSSWIMASGFGEHGPQARGILTYSLSSNPQSPHFRDQTEMFSAKQWVDLPFNRQQVQYAAERNYRVSASRVKTSLH
jgi:acyl-homoserine-lactone acylase